MERFLLYSNVLGKHLFVLYSSYTLILVHKTFLLCFPIAFFRKMLLCLQVKLYRKSMRSNRTKKTHSAYVWEVLNLLKRALPATYNIS